MFRRKSWSSGYRASAGFTLVELLVVISIIGMLMALLLPAVQSARETGRRNTCQSNQHNLALALMQYNDTKKNYPGWNNWLNASAAGAGLSNANLVYAETTYIVPLLPYLDQNPVYTNYTQYLSTLMSGGTNTNQLYALGQSQVYMAILVCPSNPPQATVGATPLAYVINGGQIDAKSASAAGAPILQGGSVLGFTVGTAPVTNSTILQTVAASSGIAYDQTGYSSYGASTSGPGPIVRVTQDYVASQDGTTYTLLTSENTEATSSWSLLTNGAAAAGPSVNTAYTVQTPASAANVPVQQLTTTFMWANSGGSGSSLPQTNYFGINGDKSNTAAADVYHARPASSHNGVVVVSFCGGNVRPLNQDIDYRTYKQLMTPFGGTSSTGTPTVYNGSYDLDSNSWPLDESKF